MSAVFDFELRKQVAQALAAELDCGLRPQDEAIRVAANNLCFAVLVPPEIARDDRQIVRDFLACTFGRNSLQLIVQGVVPNSALLALARFAEEKPLVENGRKALTPAHAAACELAMVFLALDKPIGRGGPFEDTLRSCLDALDVLETSGDSERDNAATAARWVVAHLDTIRSQTETPLH